MVYHSDEIPLDIGLSLTGLQPMHCVYCNFDTVKIVLSWYKATFLIFKKHVYFSVTSIAVNDINVKDGNVKNPVCTRNRYGSKVCIVIADKGKMNQLTMDM